jgi:hypothetical protein
MPATQTKSPNEEVHAGGQKQAIADEKIVSVSPRTKQQAELVSSDCGWPEPDQRTFACAVAEAGFAIVLQPLLNDPRFRS